MKKPSLHLVTGILLPALLCILAGYLTGNISTPDPSNKLSPGASRRAPQPASQKGLSSPVLKTDSTAPDFDKLALDTLLSRLTRLSTLEQLIQETKSLKKAYPGSAKFRIYSTFLSYKWGQIAPQYALEPLRDKELFAGLYKSLIIQGWAETNPEEAASYLSAYSQNLAGSKGILTPIAKELGRTSPDEAMQWLSTLSQDARKGALMPVLSGIAETAPEQLSKRVSQLTPEDWDDDTLHVDLARQWASADWEAAAQWINSLPQPKKEQARSAALSKLSLLDLEKTTAELKKLPLEEQRTTLSDIAFTLSETDPLNALEWLASNTPEELIEPGMEIAFHFNLNMSRTSVRNSALKEYIINMKEGPLKDAALCNMIKETCQTWDSADFEENLALSNDITDLKKREQSISSVLEQWQQADPEKAMNWVKTSSLPKKMKQEQRDACEKALKP